MGEVLDGNLGQGDAVHRSLHDNFVGAYRVHAVEHAFSTPIGAALHSEQRCAIVKDAGQPCAGAIPELTNGGRSHLLVARTERAAPAGIVNVRHHRALARNYPAPGKRIQTKFSHV